MSRDFNIAPNLLFCIALLCALALLFHEMNIFFLSICPRRAAKFHCDKHCVKMILETAQMLYTVWFLLDKDMLKKLCPYEPYKATHMNHPCNVWVRSSYQNYRWLILLGVELCREYTLRYKKEHKCEQHIRWMYELSREECVDMFPSVAFTMPPLAMPEECKTKNNPIKSYREYYIQKKSSFAKWKFTRVPKWYSLEQ